MPPSNSLQESFAKSVAELTINGDIAIAVSGGADSMALTLLANEWAKKNNCKITALTVNHAIRKESKSEAEQVSKWLQQKNIEHHILKWQGGNKTSNIQSNARDARYRLMTDFCKSNNIPNLLVAHNKEDQAENVLLRLMRGSGVDGLCGMKNKTNIGKIDIYRPLLNTAKAELRKFIKQQKQQWIEDPSNKDDKYARSRVRKFIESNDDSRLLINRLIDTAENITRSKSYIDEKIADDFAYVSQIMPEGYAILDADALCNLHIEAQYKILSKLIKNIGGSYYKPRFEKIITLHKNILNGTDATLGGCNVFKSKKKNDSGKIYITREVSSIPCPLDVKSNSEIIWDERFCCNIGNLGIDNLRVGALGKEGFAQICKENPSLKKIKLPKQVIYSIPALKTLEKTLSAPHIGYYNDKKLKDGFRSIFLFYSSHLKA